MSKTKQITGIAHQPRTAETQVIPVEVKLVGRQIYVGDGFSAGSKITFTTGNKCSVEFQSKSMTQLVYHPFKENLTDNQFPLKPDEPQSFTICSTACSTEESSFDFIVRELETAHPANGSSNTYRLVTKETGHVSGGIFSFHQGIPKTVYQLRYRPKGKTALLFNSENPNIDISKLPKITPQPGRHNKFKNWYKHENTTQAVIEFLVPAEGTTEKFTLAKLELADSQPDRKTLIHGKTGQLYGETGGTEHVEIIIDPLTGDSKI